MKDLIIIGGGVAGLMAAGIAAAEGLSVVVLEKMEKPARKLRITGKGRCNITNTRQLDDFLAKIPQGKEFVKLSLEKFTNEDTAKFFKSIGVPLSEERGGRIYPASGKAWDVADALANWAKRNGAEIRCYAEVRSVIKNSENFEIELANEKINCKKVLIATGGVSYPSTGSTGDGYQFAYDLGHMIVPVRPALVPMDIGRTDHYRGLELKNVGLRLVVNGAVADERFGDVDFTDRALGGAIVLQMSRIAVDAIIDKKEVSVELDLKPALSEIKLSNRIKREIEAMPTATYKVLLQKLIPSQLHAKIVEQSGLKLAQPIASLTDSQIQTIVSTLKSLCFRVNDYRPFSEAIITAGGVDLAEVLPETMESRLVRGLYFAGEVLDIDADTGGFNIQIALSTAYVAAKSISEK